VAWPFAQWGLDQVGPLPKSSRGGHTYLLVTIDKFSKWIEAAPVTNQEATMAVKFFESITCNMECPTASSLTTVQTSPRASFKSSPKS
jgi:hypothetical protein